MDTCALYVKRETVSLLPKNRLCLTEATPSPLGPCEIKGAPEPEPRKRALSLSTDEAEGGRIRKKKGRRGRTGENKRKLKKAEKKHAEKTRKDRKRRKEKIKEKMSQGGEV